MKIDLESAWKRKLSTSQTVEQKQAALNDLVNQQGDATKALNGAKDDDSKADDSLLTGVQAVPPDKAPVTSDGTVLLLVGGSLHVLATTPASGITFDDGSPDTAPAPDPVTKPPGDGTTPPVPVTDGGSSPVTDGTTPALPPGGEPAPAAAPDAPSRPSPPPKPPLAVR